MTLTTPSSARIHGCDDDQYRLWDDPSKGGGDAVPIWAQHHYLNNAGEEQSLWILDVDGAVLVIDTSVGADARFRDRADAEIFLRQSIRIDPRD